MKRKNGRILQAGISQVNRRKNVNRKPEAKITKKKESNDTGLLFFFYF